MTNEAREIMGKYFSLLLSSNKTPKETTCLICQSFKTLEESIQLEIIEPPMDEYGCGFWNQSILKLFHEATVYDSVKKRIEMLIWER